MPLHLTNYRHTKNVAFCSRNIGLAKLLYVLKGLIALLIIGLLRLLGLLIASLVLIFVHPGKDEPA